MDDGVNAVFSECLGWKVVLVYLGPNRRKVLGNIAPGSTAAAAAAAARGGAGADGGVPKESWLGSMTRGLPSLWGMGSRQGQDEEAITFADIAPYLVVTEESLRDVSERLPEGVEMDGPKFRPIIVLEGAEAAWKEDFWGGVAIRGSEGSECEIVLTSNCARCVSVNVDYTTGQAAGGEEGRVLKKLMSDRRVDTGTKWSPVFGRYGFLKGREQVVSIGDEAVVSRWNHERTTFSEFD